jgi:hypothetical protein
MNTLELLTEAIQRRKTITFEYIAEDRATGLRQGYPHAVFIDRTNNVNIHVYKTAGVATKPTVYPVWRTYTLANVANVAILDLEPCFEIAPRYNPFSVMYDRVIVKA